jgi:purine-binding chemotaxis protein CheW
VDTERQFVVFNMEDEDYGIDIKDIHEIVRPKEILINPVPKTPAFVQGIINLRGEVVPIINLRSRFELSDKEISGDSRIIIVRLDRKMIGLTVDKVSEVIDIMSNEINPPPEETKDIHSRYIKGVGKKGDRLVTILDIKEVLNITEEGR